ncbi:mon2-like protein [Dermatophagoides farinae]|uniref:Mon2-like protein n=1 Tax=Dermatophagoides farinae TaxID=6954 RepID=A0A9D4NYV7_DERFA|nr:mon2-like protein [Dermatophagoides farinae]
MPPNESTFGSSERKFLDELQHNFNQLASEAKKKFPHVKEACETGIIRVRNVASSAVASTTFKDLLANESAQLMEPFFMGCDTRWPKLVQISLNAIQKSILFECLNKQAAENLINCLWNLMEHGLEEVKVLQTITLLITTNQLIQDEQLAKIISLCFRLYNAKNSTTANTASATIRQLITAIFERVVNIDNTASNNNNNQQQSTVDKTKLFEIIVSNDTKTQDSCHRYIPIRFKTKPLCMDAYNVMQDLIQIINGETTFWLKMPHIDIDKLFALELLELIINQYPSIFYNHDEFIFILKDKVCQVVIKLFAPNLKFIRNNHRHHHNHQLSFNPLLQKSSNNDDSINDSTGNSSVQTVQISPPQWPTTVRLMRIVSVLIKNFFQLLITESEIFLTQLIRSLEVDKLNWQRLIALEALFKILDAQTLAALCQYYDSSMQSSKILRDIVNALCIFIQSQFQIVDSSSTQSLIASLVNNNSGNVNGNFSGSSSVANNNSLNQSINRTNTNVPCDQFPTFNLRNITTTLLFIPLDNSYRYKTFYIDQLDKQEPPQAPNGHGLSTGIACVFEVADSLLKIIETYLEITIDTKLTNNINCGDVKSAIQKRFVHQTSEAVDFFQLHRQLMLSTYTGLIGSFCLLLDASADEKCTELILDQMQKLIIIYGMYDVDVARDSLFISLCKSALPSNYCSLRALNPDNIISADDDCQTNKSNETNSTLLSTNTNASSMAANLYSSSSSLLSNSSINLTNLLQQQNNHPQPMNSNKSTLESSTNNSSLNYQHEYNQQVIAVGTPLPVNNDSTFSNNSTVQSQQHQQQQNSGPVMLTAKNLQCMRSIMHLSMTYGGLYREQSWHIVFTTLQHLVWILGIKPNNSRAYKLSNYYQASNCNVQSIQPDQQLQSQQSLNAEQIVGSTVNDLPVLTAMLSRLFECTQNIPDDSLLTMMKALMTISNEAMEIAYNNREPSLFAVVKIHESALVNMTRIDLFWDLITNHLIQVSSHPYNKLRESAVEVVCNLVQSVLNYRFMKQKNHDDKNSSLSPESCYLLALQSLSQIKFIDIKQKQIECLLRILQSNGEDITVGWPILFNIIESACLPQNDKLVVHSFQCYEFIVSNLLRYIPSIHLIHCINAAVAFGSQVQELNVSLSAVGLVWNVADFLHSNHDQIQSLIDNFILKGHKFVSIDLPFCEDLTPVQSLWISLFKNLSNLCTDARLSVRKSSVQTLMSTLSKHGQTLDYNTWKAIFFYILFPLVDSVRTLCSLASNEKITQSESSKPNSYGDDSDSYMIHYSRNTAFKQWCETQVSVINGVSRIISIKLDMLIEHSMAKPIQSNNEPNELNNSNNSETILLNIWTLFFEFIFSSSTCTNEEVSMSAIKCFNEIVSFLNDYQANNNDAGGDDDYINRLISLIWKNVWKTWCNIGHHIAANNNVFPSSTTSENSCFDSEQQQQQRLNNNEETTNFLPSQSYLCSFIQSLNIILSKYIHHLTESDFKNMSHILQNVMTIPFDVITETYHHSASYRNHYHHHHHHHHHNHPIMQTSDNSSSSSLLTSLQHEILMTMEKIQTEVVSNLTTLNHLLPLIYYQYLTFSLYAVNIVPPNLNVFISSQFQHRFLPGELTTFKSATFYIFGELALRNAFNLYMCTYMESIVIKSHILHSLIKAYKIPLCFKYSCPLQTTWKYAVNYFIKTLELGLPLARRYPADFISIWADLALTFEGFLFPSNKPPSNQKLEEQQMDESLDVKVVELIRDHIMIHAQKIPKEFLLQIVSILNRGSIHSPSITSIETEMNRKLREDFARICFQTLLQFSFFGPKGNPDLFIQSSKTNLNVENIGQSSAEQTIGIVNKLAVASILKRFNDVIIKYVEDEQLCPCPLPRHRLSEISFVLKALATLIASLKEAPPAAVENHVWQQLIQLYPRIVDCTMSNSPQVNNSIREVLHQYAYLLQSPVVSPLSTPLAANKQQFEPNGNIYPHHHHNHHNHNHQQQQQQQQQQHTALTKLLPTATKTVDNNTTIKSITEKNFQRNVGKNAEINI